MGKEQTAKRLICNFTLPMSPNSIFADAVVTQLGECHAEDVDVAGSSPANRTFTFLLVKKLIIHITIKGTEGGICQLKIMKD